MRKIIVYALWLLIPLISRAQPGKPDVTGIWKGQIYVDSTKMYYPYELSLSEEKGKLRGWSRISFEQKGIRHVVIRDHTVEWEGDKLIIEDEKQLAKGSSINQPRDVRKKMTVTISPEDSTLHMSGTWATNRTRVYLVATGTVDMKKEKDFRQSELFKKLDSLSMTSNLSYSKPAEPVVAVQPPVVREKAPDPEVERYLVKKASLELPVIALNRKPVKIPALSPKRVPVIKAKTLYFAVKEKPATQPPVARNNPTAVNAGIPQAPKPKLPGKQNTYANTGSAATDFASRNNKTQQEVYFRSDSLQLTLYDNGEIDGDTVSVLMNGRVIIAKQGLTTQKNVHTVYINEDTPDSIQLVMYAENLGSIPPNTGLLIVKDGSSVYEVRFSADLKTNAAIILRRKKDE